VSRLNPAGEMCECAASGKAEEMNDREIAQKKEKKDKDTP